MPLLGSAVAPQGKSKMKMGRGVQWLPSSRRKGNKQCQTKWGADQQGKVSNRADEVVKPQQDRIKEPLQRVTAQVVARPTLGHN